MIPNSDAADIRHQIVTAFTLPGTEYTQGKTELTGPCLPGVYRILVETSTQQTSEMAQSKSTMKAKQSPKAAQRQRTENAGRTWTEDALRKDAQDQE